MGRQLEADCGQQMWKMTDESPVASRRRHQAESSRTEAEEKKCLAACGLWEDVVAAGLVPGGRRWCVKVEGGPEGGGWAAEVAGRRRRQCWRHGGLQNRALEGRLVVFADAGKVSWPGKATTAARTAAVAVRGS